MSLMADLKSLSDNASINEYSIGLPFFKSLQKNRSLFNNYSPITLYRAYIMEYIILLWDNTYYLLINNGARSTKLRGISDNLLGQNFINSSGYVQLVKLQDFLEHNYFDRYSLIRYLTQAWSNYLFNKEERYRYIHLDRIYSSKVKQQYLELSQGLVDDTIKEDNLSFANDPVTIALLNYYYYLDEFRYNKIVDSFELSLFTSLDDKLADKYGTIKNTEDKALIMGFINAVGIQRESFTTSYGNNLLLNQNIMTFEDIDLQCKADRYLANGNKFETDLPITITLSLSRLGLYKKLLNTICSKQLGCRPLDKEELKKYKQLGLQIDTINSIRLESM